MDAILGHGIRLSLDGKGRWVDNVFIERLWRSVKYEAIYLHAYDSVDQARQGLSRYFRFDNERRPHASLDGRTPDAVYFQSPPLNQAAPAHCQEAGRTLRFVAHRYRYSLLLSALYGPNGTNGSEEEAEEENGGDILAPLRLIPGGEPEGDPGED